MRDYRIKWLHKALELKSGEEIYLASDSHKSAHEQYKAFRQELAILREIDEKALGIRIYTTFKDGSNWVVLKMISISPRTGFKKSDGKVERINIES